MGIRAASRSFQILQILILSGQVYDEMYICTEITEKSPLAPALKASNVKSRIGKKNTALGVTCVWHCLVLTGLPPAGVPSELVVAGPSHLQLSEVAATVGHSSV